MPIRNTGQRYGSVAMSLHWLIAALVITNISLGLYMGDLPRGDPNQFTIIQIHKSIGLTVLVLSVIVIVWRLMNPPPPLPVGMSPALRLAARTTLVLLYVLIVTIPLSGWIMVSASPLGNPTPYFFLFGWPNLPFFSGMTRAAVHPYHEFYTTIHVWLAWSAIVLVPIHVLAALYHQFILRDRLLARMVPGMRSGA
ncbi:MAG: cytochrome b [Rhizomicrobium sp.]